jgi:hypothetical protein
VRCGNQAPSKSGGFAIFAAIRRASSLLIWFAACVNSFIKAEHVFDGIQNGRVGVFVAI